MSQPLPAPSATDRTRLTRGQIRLYAVGWIVLVAGLGAGLARPRRASSRTRYCTWPAQPPIVSS